MVIRGFGRSDDKKPRLWVAMWRSNNHPVLIDRGAFGKSYVGFTRRDVVAALEADAFSQMKAVKIVPYLPSEQT